MTTTSIETILSQQGFLLHSIKGVSMMPLLRQNKDVVLIKKKTPGMVFHKYDVVLFRRPNGAYVLHRIVEVLENEYVKKEYIIIGDNSVQRERVPEEWILGILTEINRAGKVIPVSNPNYLRYVKIWYEFPLLRRVYRRGRFYRFGV